MIIKVLSKSIPLPSTYVQSLVSRKYILSNIETLKIQRSRSFQAFAISSLLIVLTLNACLTPNPTWLDSIEKSPSPAPAIILMIGDGMGLSQVSAAMYSQKDALALESFPVIGFHKAYAASDLITDSAAGATAFACGIKTYNNAIGMGPDTLPRFTILEEAEQNGLATGLIATASIVHATPASFAAHQPLRIFYERIAQDFAKANIDLLIGGGKKYFDRLEMDNQNLIDTLEAHNGLVRDFLYTDLDHTRPDIEKNFIYFAADDNPLPVSHGRSYLSYASKMGCRFLDAKSHKKGFFLMIEGSQIDWANHANEGNLMIQETLDFDRAIGEVLRFAKQRGNTLVIVTADHESGGVSVNGKNKRGAIETVFTTNGHTGTLVPVFAYGPKAEIFSGIYENTAIYHKMRAFLGW